MHIYTLTELSRLVNDIGFQLSASHIYQLDPKHHDIETFFKGQPV